MRVGEDLVACRIVHQMSGSAGRVKSVLELLCFGFAPKGTAPTGFVQHAEDRQDWLSVVKVHWYTVCLDMSG